MSAKQYDTLSNEIILRLAHRALANYPQYADATVRLLCRSENATLLVSHSGSRFALRIHRADYHDRGILKVNYSGWMPCAALVLQYRKRSEMTGASGFSYYPADGGHRYGVLFHWIDGEMPTTEVDPVAFRQLGHITARLHQHSRNWQKPAGFRRIIWDHQTMVSAASHWGDWRDAPGLAPREHQLVEEVIQHVGQQMKEFGQSPKHYGLIHADLRLTNLLLHHGETRVIDFDDCGMGWYLHDLAAAISFVEHHACAPQWIENWLCGYEQVAHISDRELALLPAMLIQRRIQLTAWVASHRETEMAHSTGMHGPATPCVCVNATAGTALP